MIKKTEVNPRRFSHSLTLLHPASGPLKDCNDLSLALHAFWCIASNTIPCSNKMAYKIELSTKFNDTYSYSYKTNCNLVSKQDNRKNTILNLTWIKYKVT